MSFPPPNYIPTKSAIPGIKLYKRPSREAEAGPHQKVVSFNCPQCDATTAFSAADGGLTCSHCGFYEPPRKPIVGKGAEEFGFSVETVERAAHGWGVERMDLHCQRCGAHTVIPPDSLTHTCPFCGSNNVIQQKAPQDALRPRFLIPFKFEAEACRKIAREWLGNSWMTPVSLKNQALLTDFVPVFIPFWTFDARITAVWKGHVLQTLRPGEVNPRSKRLSCNDDQDMCWETGVAKRRFDDHLVSGSTRLSRALLGRIQRYDLHELLEYEPKLLAGQQAQAYDLPLDEAWQQARHTMRERTRQQCYEQATSTHILNFSMNLTFDEESWRYILLPVYIAIYHYRGQIFEVMVNGQTGAISGPRPVGWFMIWLTIIGYTIPATLVTLLGILLRNTIDNIGFVFVLAFILALIAIGAAYNLIRQAQAMEDF